MCSQAVLVTRSSFLLLNNNYFFLSFFMPTFMRGRAMGNETFYGDGLSDIKIKNRLMSLFKEGWMKFLVL